jgi:glycosyltransferase involved in cell wall biosynthesis
MLKVMQVYFEPQASGQTTHVRSLASGLDRQRFDLTVALPRHLEVAIASFRQAGVRVIPLPLRKLTWQPGTIREFARLVDRLKIDIVHVHSQEAGMVFRLAARLAGARTIVYTPQTIDIRRSRWHWLYALVERTLAKVTDTIVSVNEADRQRLIGWGIPAGQVVTVPNGIDLAPFEQVPDLGPIRKELGLAEGRPVVMQLGRLSAQKDPLAFVEGASLVAQSWPDTYFVLVGDGPLREALSARIRELGLSGQVHLAGWRNDAVRLMPAASVVTLTSRWEGNPYALLEAMAWARPVVATTVNGCPEIVVEGTTGFLVPPGEPEAWAGRVGALLADPDRARVLGRQGRKRLVERFSLPQMIARIEALYDEAFGAG